MAQGVGRRAQGAGRRRGIHKCRWRKAEGDVAVVEA
jgi:hypothetical protein